ncbi:hypothetical protein SAMN05518871_11075 [Psychrobacillus sp. OK028]|nr:hypothetical protein SAMN05518871_11075 [Psychrobacillus sp. OK028]
MANSRILLDSATTHAKPNDEKAILCMRSYNLIYIAIS